MPSSQHDGASDEGEKRNGNGSQDRWHQRPGSGARSGRGSGSLRHNCAAHCSHHHNSDQGGAPHCCQSRSHCADDDEEVHKETEKGSDALLSCKPVCSTELAPQENLLCLIDSLLLQEEAEKKDREPASKWRSGEDARKRGFVQ